MVFQSLNFHCYPPTQIGFKAMCHLFSFICPLVPLNPFSECYAPRRTSFWVVCEPVSAFHSKTLAFPAVDTQFLPIQPVFTNRYITCLSAASLRWLVLSLHHLISLRFYLCVLSNKLYFLYLTLLWLAFWKEKLDLAFYLC